MHDNLEAKTREIVFGMKTLKARLESGDDSQLLLWIIPDSLASAQRPLRHHPQYAGSGVVLPSQAASLVVEWAASVRVGGIASIISFMHDRDRRCYGQLELGAADINAFYENQGFKVARIPWEDPHHSRADVRTKRKNLERFRAEALKAFDALPKPVLLQCSSGVDRSAPVGAYIWQQRSAV